MSEKTPPPSRLRAILASMVRWFDTGAGKEEHPPADRVEWMRCLPFVAMHLMCLGVIWVGWSWTAAGVAAALYAVRMFAITAFYHRYFSHRSFKTSRAWQFVFAVLGNAAVQRGPLWWAAHHRDHHRLADTAADIHSPLQHGLIWSHVGWITSRANFATRMEAVPDLARYPELRFLDRFDVVVPAALAGLLYWAGGWQMLIWGFFISTVALFHATCTINSLSHRFGTRRYETRDESRNNLALALITFGEGWHNNHHYYPAAARQGFFWWEIDLTWYLLRLLAALRIVRDLKGVPESVRAAARAT